MDIADFRSYFGGRRAGGDGQDYPESYREQDRFHTYKVAFFFDLKRLMVSSDIEERSGQVVKGDLGGR